MNIPDNRLRVVLLPVARTTFDMPLANATVARARESLAAAGVLLSGPPEAVVEPDDLETALGVMDNEEIDVTVLLQASFADSRMARRVAERTRAPLLLWAVPESPTGGRLRLNSYCGVNLAAHALKRAALPYAVVYAAPGDPQAVTRIRQLGAAGQIKRRLRGLRIGRLGTNPDGFESCTVDATALQQKFGVTVVPVEQGDFFASVECVDAGQVEKLREDLRPRVAGLDQVAKDPTDKTLGAYLAIEDLAERQRLDAFAVRCWPEFFTEMGCAACGALSLASDQMVPATCESDVNGAVTGWILQTIAGTPAFDTDIVAFDESSDSVVFWHCGKAPLSLADPHVMPRATIHSNRQLPLLWEFPLKPGIVTLARLSMATGDYRLTLARGEMLRAEPSFTGTSGRCRFSQPAPEFMERILAEGLEHHMTLVYGDHVSTLRALATHLELPLLEL